MTTPHYLAAAREAFAQGDMKRTRLMIHDALLFKGLELMELEEIEAMLSVVAARSTGRSKAAAESMAQSVAIRKGPFLAEAQAEGSSRARLAAWPQLPTDGRVARFAHDPLLVALARAADAGEALPAVRLMTGNGLFVGRPGPAIGFLEEARTPLKREQLAAQPKDEPSDYAAAVARALHAVHDRVEIREEDDPTALTIYGARWYASAGNLGFDSLPAVRIPLAAVSGWWIAGGVAVAPPKEQDKAAPWFAGIAIPIG